MRKFLAGVASLALAAGTAVAEPGGGKGGGKGEGGGKGPPSAQVERGGGESKGNKGGKAERGPAERGPAERQTVDRGKPDRGERGDNFAQREERGSDRSQKERGAARRDDGDARRGDRRSDEVRAVRGKDGDDRGEFVEGNRGRADDLRRDEGREVVRVVDRRRWSGWDELDRRGLVDGCPPGLAKKNTGCLPPGQFRKVAGLGLVSSPLWWGFDGLDGDRFDYVDGYLVRIDDDGVDGWLPLLGGALAPGHLWPSAFAPVDLPPYYEDYYGLGPEYGYYDDVLYRLDPETSAISSIAALLTGDDFAVGQQLPLGYDIYNVPYDYRDRYADGPDALYRYSDGYIYQVDPETRLVAAAIELLT